MGCLYVMCISTDNRLPCLYVVLFFVYSDVYHLFSFKKVFREVVF